MSKITLKLNYTRLPDYNENEFEKFLKTKINEEPNDHKKYDVRYTIEFNDNGCIIYAESSILGEKGLLLEIQGNIMCIGYEYKHISNLNFEI